MENSNEKFIPIEFHMELQKFLDKGIKPIEEHEDVREQLSKIIHAYLRSHKHLLPR